MAAERRRNHYSVRVGGIVDAPMAVVWDMIADARRYSSWAAMPVSRLEREGDEVPDGVGAIRNLGTAGFVSREEVVEFDPPTHLAYVLLSGLPITDYRADVRLEPLGDHRTRVVWVGTFRSSGVTGAIMQRFLTLVLGDFVRRLTKHAPRR